MERPRKCGVGIAMLFLVLFAGYGSGADAAEGKGGKAPDGNPVERGRYLSKIAGCHDCHTPGYLLSEGKVPESLWLTGDRFGWRGPWGTTYAANLRLFFASLTEDRWVAVAGSIRTRPPMPWFTLNEWQEEDLRALYRFVRHLGPAGPIAPAFVPPDREPDTPYALFPSPPK